MKRKNQNQNLSKFIIYISYVLTITFLLLSHLWIKHSIGETELEISKMHENHINNLNIVKELQSNREFLMSENYINDYLKGQMSVVTPETLLIQVKAKE